MKRMRGEGGLTGGTGDVNPQFLTFRATQSGNDATTTTTQSIPIQRLQDRGGAQVMEVLKVWFRFPQVGEVDSQYLCYLSTKSFGTTAIASEPTVFAFYQKTLGLTTSGTFAFQEPFMVDTTDGSGHGIIVATDNIYAQIVTSTTGATNSCDIKILYRWKNVGLQEYIGIVQGQQ